MADTTRAPASPFQGVKPFSFFAVAVCLLILLSLGVWQVQRLAWKEALLARIAALQSAPPEPLGVVLHRLGDRGEVDFVRVQADCATVQQTPTIRLYAILDGVMGYRLITACPIVSGPYRSLLVDRGFTPNERIAQAAAPEGPISAPVVGVLRKPEPHTWLTPVNTPATAGEPQVWRSRDLPAMAAALKAPAPAPVFLMLEQPVAPPGGPVAAAIPDNIPNNHLGYALTWFGLAAGLVGVYGASVLRARRG